MIQRKQEPPTEASLDETDHADETFEIETTQGEHEFVIATAYEIVFNEDGPSFLKVWGDDDFTHGPAKLRVFNLDYVVDYGWTK